ncbi:bifunctional aminoglycoside phosphotransferase/ATP-binding protein [Mycobacterium sp. GA-1199]|uniref:bifunctional aminoglycoside phosphotransferase/ATP-binding protein n=1 Tax=Mycobacterium sp. GA-1199 TaxID=1772287 RepID=UPI0009EAB8B2|nr:bifunctional aminoglycoside phosphotransferase/ATP-binding protein [Mycobacterium sp. GA-1199]
MSASVVEADSGGVALGNAGNLQAQARETHTGVVVLVGDRAYKVKKPVLTDFLDFRTPELRAAACEREVALNRRLSPESYLGVGHFAGPDGGSDEPVVVMRRYADSLRLASMIRDGRPVYDQLDAIAQRVAEFHRHAARSEVIDACGRPGAVAARWRQNLDQLALYTVRGVLGEQVREIRRLAERFMAGRSGLFERRIAQGRVVDGHGDLLADDIFCPGDHLAILDCLEFDDSLRFVDAVDDVSFLAMDLEFLGRQDLAELFLDSYRRHSGDTAPSALTHFYIAYRAVVRAKVDCVRVDQGHDEARADARRHIDIAFEHLRSGTVQLIIVGGGPGTGKSTLSRALAELFDAEVISTDDVRKQMQGAGAITGSVGEVNTGLYSPQNVSAVYQEVLRRATNTLSAGRSVILDGTWRNAEQRERARRIADRVRAPLVILTCSAPLEEAALRIETRAETTSDATPHIAAAIAQGSAHVYGGHLIDTTRSLADSVAQAQQICCTAI